MRRRGHRFVAPVLGVLLVVGCSRPAADSGAPVADPPYENLRYTVEGEPVHLIGGIAESEAAPGSASKVVTRSIGNALQKDLNGDGREDIAFLLTQDRSGSGTFYYVVAALQTEDGWVGSHALLLGDRIAPRAVSSGSGRSLVVSYAEHPPGEPMASPPSRERRRQLLLDPETLQFQEIADDSAGDYLASRLALEVPIREMPSGRLYRLRAESLDPRPPPEPAGSRGLELSRAAGSQLRLTPEQARFPLVDTTGEPPGVSILTLLIAGREGGEGTGPLRVQHVEALAVVH